MQDSNAKQQIVERIRNSANILVTVSANPSVDALSAALGFSLMLNKMDKHATAVFSGQVPPAISFLEPEKTFEGSIDSLRDFIIALDKEKADRLRYKVEDDVVRIFITPYRTVIGEKDLQFSQGDFNVDLIVALGVEKRNDLDTAITAHGRILHDAAVVTVNANDDSSDLGNVDWHDKNASSLCEMLMSLSEALQPGLLDEQISTSLLTGIVAATDRFSNQHTSPRVMTMAAQLMAAGANQQLIATKLEQHGELPTQNNKDGSTDLKEGQSSKVADNGENSESTVKKDGEMVVHHEPKPSADEVGKGKDYEKEIADHITLPPVADGPTLDTLEKQLAEEAAAKKAPAPPKIKSTDETRGHHRTWMPPEDEPRTGGTLSATSEKAREERIAAERADLGRPILSHDAPPAKIDEPEAAPAPEKPAEPEPEPEPEAPELPDLQFEEAPLPPPRKAEPVAETPLPPPPAVEEVPSPAASTDTPLPPPPAEPVQSEPAKDNGDLTLAEIEERARALKQAEPADLTADDLARAREEVKNVIDNAPFNPANNPEASMGAKTLGEVSHETDAKPDTEVSQAPPPFEAPLPDFSTLPPPPPLPTTPNPPEVPSQNGGDTLPPTAPPAVPTPPANQQPQTGQQPGQFQIPGK